MEVSITQIASHCLDQFEDVAAYLANCFSTLSDIPLWQPTPTNILNLLNAHPQYCLILWKALLEAYAINKDNTLRSLIGTPLAEYTLTAKVQSVIELCKSSQFACLGILQHLRPYLAKNVPKWLLKLCIHIIIETHRHPQILSERLCNSAISTLICCSIKEVFLLLVRQVLPLIGENINFWKLRIISYILEKIECKQSCGTISVQDMEKIRKGIQIKLQNLDLGGTDAEKLRETTLYFYLMMKYMAKRVGQGYRYVIDNIMGTIDPLIYGYVILIIAKRIDQREAKLCQQQLKLIATYLVNNCAIRRQNMRTSKLQNQATEEVIEAQIYVFSKIIKLLYSNGNKGIAHRCQELQSLINKNIEFNYDHEFDPQIFGNACNAYIQTYCILKKQFKTEKQFRFDMQGCKEIRDGQKDLSFSENVIENNAQFQKEEILNLVKTLLNLNQSTKWQQRQLIKHKIIQVLLLNPKVLEHNAFLVEVLYTHVLHPSFIGYLGMLLESSSSKLPPFQELIDAIIPILKYLSIREARQVWSWLFDHYCPHEHGLKFILKVCCQQEEIHAIKLMELKQHIKTHCCISLDTKIAAQIFHADNSKPQRKPYLISALR